MPRNFGFLSFRFSFRGVAFSLDGLLPILLGGLTWVLSVRYFPNVYEGGNNFDYWHMGIISSFGLFLSILFHELGHAFAALSLNIPIERIRIFLLGGSVELRHRPLLPSEEFFVSLSGPISSILLSIIFFTIASSLGSPGSLNYELYFFLSKMNAFVAFFNLLPIFPLDGGRALRSLIWKYKKNFYLASRLMHRIGSSAIGLLFIASLIVFFGWSTYQAFWLGLFGLYVAYLIMRAKSELVQLPVESELIYTMKETDTPAQIISNILDTNHEALKKAVIPVIIEGKLHAVIFGNELQAASHETLSIAEFLRHPTVGTYIDLEDDSTYTTTDHFKYEFVPIFKQGRFIGLGDALELRFWLQETKNLNVSIF